MLQTLERHKAKIVNMYTLRELDTSNSIFFGPGKLFYGIFRSVLVCRLPFSRSLGILNVIVQSVGKQTKQFLVFVIFSDDMFSRNRYLVYESCICRLYVAVFCYGCHKNTCTRIKPYYSRNCDKNRRDKKNTLIITSLPLFQSSQIFQHIQKTCLLPTNYYHFYFRKICLPKAAKMLKMLSIMYTNQ